MPAARSFFVSSSFIVSKVGYNTTILQNFLLYELIPDFHRCFSNFTQRWRIHLPRPPLLDDLKGGRGGSSRLRPGPCAYFGPGARVGGLRTAGQGSWVQKPKTPNVYYYPVCSGLAFGGEFPRLTLDPAAFFFGFLRCTSSSLLPPPICSLKNVGKRIKEYEWMISEVIWA